MQPVKRSRNATQLLSITARQWFGFLQGSALLSAPGMGMLKHRARFSAISLQSHSKTRNRSQASCLLVKRSIHLSRLPVICEEKVFIIKWKGYAPLRSSSACASLPLSGIVQHNSVLPKHIPLAQQVTAGQSWLKGTSGLSTSKNYHWSSVFHSIVSPRVNYRPVRKGSWGNCTHMLLLARKMADAIQEDE